MCPFYILDNEEENELYHYGVARRSGRYPWGSGDDPYQRTGDFISRVEEMRKAGTTYTDPKTGKTYTGDTAIAKTLNMSTTQFKTEIGIARSERRSLQVARCKSLAEDKLTPTQIGKIMGLNESTVRSLLNEKSEARMKQAQVTADKLKSIVNEKGMVDVGVGVERELGISREKMNQALYLLEREGYPVYSGRIQQVTNPTGQTTQKVLCIPGTKHKDIYDLSKVHSLEEYTSHDNGETFNKLVYPKSLDSKRLKIVLADEEGITKGQTGADKDGLIEIRRNTPDLSLGDSKYSQVRILVDDKKYIKGMAVYSDDLPDGIDIVFNSSKTSADKALKNISDDPKNPFGALIKANGQSYYTDENGKKQLSLINKPREEGDWDEWKDALPAQFLSKQPLSLAKKQLTLAKVNKEAEFDEINSLTNPTVKKYFLKKFADECDSDAVDLKAASLPGQKYHVIIPINTLKDSEVYAPNYENGSKLALVRYPHGGTFEIPILTVNNKHKQANEIIGKQAIDAIGINKKNASILSGADFDGDTVMCIPTHDSKGKVKISNRAPLEDLVGFEAKDVYGPASYAGKTVKLMTKSGTQREMGIITNLITDMTIAGANDNEMARAVKHSMVVIDAEKHHLNYKQSEIDNDISSLKKKYQITIDANGNEKIGGASTLISRAKGDARVPKRQGQPKVNIKGTDDYDPTRPEGSLLYKTADDATYTKVTINKRTGETKNVTKTRTTISTQMKETDDANTLVSKYRHPMELLYADYANNMKSMANKARKTEYYTENQKANTEAKKKYAAEVESLDRKLNEALLNAPKEREAQRKANVEIDTRKAEIKTNKPDASKTEINKELKKVAQRSITESRNSVGSVSRRNRNIEITDKEWEAIQSGAVSSNKLTKILANTDADKLREKAMPKTSNTLSAAKVKQIQSMANSNYTLSEIAKKMNISTSQVSKYIKEGE